jgi:branched-chain amino acid transport system substrate-binding protein
MKSNLWKLMISVMVFSLLVTACGSAATPTAAPTAAPAATQPPAATQAPAQPTATEAPTALPPIKIGISLSLSGDFSADGMGFQQGYQLWADTVNKNGGLLGRQVQLDIVSDASSPDQVQTNYEKLITVDKVDLVFGPYSSLLTKPASVVADRYGYAMLEGAGGAPSVFNRGLKNIFDVSVPVLYWLDSYSEYLLALPADQRPTSIAYATEDDPFTQPQIDRMKATMEAAGIKTAYYEVYPAETTDYNPIADKIIASKADVVVAGVFLPDLTAFVQRFRQQHYNPKSLIATSGPDLGQDFLTAMGGAPNAEGIMNPNGWFAALDNPANKQMVSDYIAQFGGTPDQINGDVAEGYAVGQVMQQVVEKIKSLDNAKILDELHSGATYDSVQGPVKFDDVGQNTAIKAYIIQWQGGKFVPIYPAVTGGTPEYPKPNWP